MITRFEYMQLDKNGCTQEGVNTPYNREEARKRHEEYFDQFVTDSIIFVVNARFSEKRLAEAYKEDRHLNNLGGNAPWDKLEPLIRAYTSSKLLKDTGEGWSLSTSICIAKAAAKRIIDAYNAKQ